VDITTINTINYGILWYFVVVSLYYTGLLISCFPDIRRKFIEANLGDIAFFLHRRSIVPITVIVPAYNEESRIMEAVHAVLRTKYRNLRVIIVNDGSTDGTLDVLKRELQLHEESTIMERKIPTAEVRGEYISSKFEHLRVIDKVHSGTGDTLNVGVNAVVTPFFATVDADTLIEPDTMDRLVFTALTRPHTVATGGAVYVLNGCGHAEGIINRPRLPNNYFAAMQTNEYLRSFIFGRSGWNLFNGGLSYAGALTFFETSPVVEIGGFDLDNPAQDAEIITRLHEHMRRGGRRYEINFNPDAFAWTVVPDSLRSYWKQRVNWQYGLMKSYLPYIRMFFNPRYGVTGLVTYPFFLLVELFGAVVEFTAYTLVVVAWLLGVLDVKAAVLLLILSWGFLGFITMATTMINFITFNKYRHPGDVLRMLFHVFLEMVAFRQIYVINRMAGTLKYAWRAVTGSVSIRRPNVSH